MTQNKKKSDSQDEKVDFISNAQDAGTSSSSDDTSASADLSGEAAGVVRGVSRSIVRGPLIGRLPATAPKPPTVTGRGLLRQRVPVRRVARVSDRVSTGWDWYTSASEVEDTSNGATKAPPTATRVWLVRARSFAWNLFRNTLLGMAVFEGYGYVIGSLAPPPSLVSMKDGGASAQMTGNFKENPSGDNSIHHGGEEGEDFSVLLLVEDDEYSRASLPIHFLAGASAGTIHGLASSAMEGSPTPRLFTRYIAWNTFHHAMAHAMLFGSYESIKRGLLQWTANNGEETETMSHRESRTYHLLTFALAGGLAGQVQHVVSHYAEQALGLSNQTLQLDLRSASRTTPALRPALWAFPPSAIGFIAFEYGKQFIT